MPLYNNHLQSTMVPCCQHELSDLAKHDSKFLYDFRKSVEKRKSLICDKYLSSSETKDALVNSAFSMVEFHSTLDFYEKIHFHDMKEIYRVLEIVSDEVDIVSFLQRYERLTGHSFHS